MIDSVKTNVEALINKAQLGYLKPMYFDSFAKNATRKIYNRYFTELKSNVRKKNWMLDGKNFADYSQFIQQCLEHFSDEQTLYNTPSNGFSVYEIPDEVEFIMDAFSGTKRVEKVDFSVLLDLRESNYTKPSDCSPYLSKVNSNIKALPLSLDTLELHYLRKPKNPKWTYVEFEGKPMLNVDDPLFQDIDLPESAFDELVSLIFESASIYLRELNVTQSANAEQSQEAQLENKE